MITHEDLAKAWDRIARGPDGELVYAFLQKVAIGLISEGCTDGALRHNLGRRSLAHEIMGLMSKGIEESAGRHRSAGGNSVDGRPLVFAVRQPAATGKPRSFRELEHARLAALVATGVIDPGPGDD